MNLLSNVRYIFQIPLEWFKRVDSRVFGDHPGSGVKFEPANDGSRAIMLDFDMLDDRYLDQETSDRVLKISDIGAAPPRGVASSTHTHTSSNITDLSQTIAAALTDYRTASQINQMIQDAISGLSPTIPENVLRTTDIGSSVSGRGVAANYYANSSYTGTLSGGVNYLFNWSGIYNGYSNLNSSHIGSSVMAYNSSLANLLDGNGKVPASKLADTYPHFASPPSSGKIVVTSGTDGTLTTLSTSGVSSTKTIVTNVTWNGSQLVVAKASAKFENGMLTEWSNATSGTIDTVVFTGV